MSPVPCRSVWRRIGPTLLTASLAISLLAGCAGSSGRTFVHPNYDFAYVERIAVVPFENLTDSRGAGARMSRTFLAELLGTMAFDVVEPGEVLKAMEAHSMSRSSEPNAEQIQALGRDLKCQGLFLGAVVEASATRSGGNTQNTVALEVRLVETETGQAVWSTSKTRSGRGFFSGVFGGSGKPMSEVRRNCARACIQELVH